jgi:hypothetical protein
MQQAYGDQDAAATAAIARSYDTLVASRGASPATEEDDEDDVIEQDPDGETRP